MHLSFGNPNALILLLGLPLFAFLARRLLSSIPGARLALALRSLIAALAVFALAQPVLASASHSLSVVFALDSSDSLDPSSEALARAFVAEALRTLPPDSQVGLVDFAQDAAVLRPLSPSHDLDPSFYPQTPRPPGQITDLSAALRLASSLFLPNGAKRIVLLTDGQENVGNARDEANHLALQGIQIDALPLGKLPDPEVVLDSLDTPPYLRAGEPVDVAITVLSSRESDGALRLWVDSDLVLNQAIHLLPGPNRFAASLAPLPKGFHAFRARIDGAPDTYPQNNETYAYSVVKDPARVLLVAANPEEAAPLQSTLARAGIITDLQPPTTIPASFAPLKPYDGMVLVDVPAKALTLDQMRTVQGFVESLGRGLFVVGGDNSFGAGDYQNTVLADLLPVQVRAPARTEVGQVAMVLVLDKSGSMDERTEDGATKIAATRQAATLAVDALGPRDYLGVLAFDTDSTWIVPPHQVGDDQSRLQIRKAIDSLQASGGTEIYPAVEAAYNAIRRIPAQYRYIVLMTDGISFSGGDYDGLTAKMRADHVVLSTIAVGEDADKDLLSKLAQQGEGRYYYTNRAGDIPKITVRETQLAAGAPKVEGQIDPQVNAPSPILRSLPSKLPPLRGQASAGVREDATTALVSQRGDPLLAHWQRGLGRVAAWTSDGGSNWAADWVSRPDLAKLWPQAVRWTLAAPLTSGLYVRSWSEGETLKLRAEAVDDTGTLLNLLDLRAQVGSTQQAIPLAQVAPGRYEAQLALPEPGVYPVGVAEYSGGQPTPRAEDAGIVVSYPEEYRRFGPDLGLLREVLAPAGGQVLTEPAGAFRRDELQYAGEERRQLWPWLLGIALALFPLDVGIRRLRVDHTFVRPYLEAASRAWHTLPLDRLPRLRR